MLNFRAQILMAIAVGASLAGSPGVSAATAAANGSSNSTVDFGREIRPIFSDICFTCHGPDDQQRKAGVRFDIRDGAFQAGKSGKIPVVPGDLSKSELIRRITTSDPDDVMPPPKAKKKLTTQQIELLKRWVSEGANWSTHWAFEKPQRPPVPAVKNSKWARNEIDDFVLAKLEKEKLKPSPEADKPTLIRRATYDVTGLPPTPQEVDAFLADKDPKAYDKLVDRLLESPRYGEHMARYWMDAARYADSHGYHIDSERSIWKWRDWVIQAYNDNKRFDQFTIEQLAGDLLPDATQDQKIASGYVRCNMSTGEGGAIVEEYQSKYTFDRTETTATIFMGLTLTCARCHTHKYDPITHKEYYGLYAFFNNLNESVMDGNRPNPEPSMKLPTAEQTQRQSWLKTELEKGQEKINAPMPELDDKQVEWVKTWQQRLQSGWATLSPTPSNATNSVPLKVLEDQSVLLDGAQATQSVHQLSFNVAKGNLTGIRLEALPHSLLPKEGSSLADDGRFRLSEIEAELITTDADGKPSSPKKIKFSAATGDTPEGQVDAAKAIDAKPNTAWSPSTELVAKPHVANFLIAEPLKISRESELHLTLRYDSSKTNRAIGHLRVSAALSDEIAHYLNPPKSEPWQVIGPFKSENLGAGLAKVYEPEEKIDLKKTYEGVREEIKWHAQGDYDDGKSHLLVDELHGVHGVYYLSRTLKLPVDRTVDFGVQVPDQLFRLWINGKVVGERTTPEKPGEPAAQIHATLKAGDNKVLLKIVNHVGGCNFTFNQDLGDKDAVPQDLAVIFTTPGELKGEKLKTVRNFYRKQNSAEFRDLVGQVEKWKTESDGIERQIPTTMVAKENDKMRDTFMLMRGEYDKKGDKVSRGTPAILSPWPKNAPTNRLGLAMWLVDPANPLTARVNVNRFWQQYFGTGLVKTAEDFGVQGERPSHRELLDWLATEFVGSGWDVKHLQRLMLTSATYRQSSHASTESRARDPENRLLARGPRFRLDGEMVRDTALYLGGLLVEKRGGHSVKPYQPGGLWEAVSYNNAQKYVEDKGEGLYRRSMYTYWKRQSPPPSMMIFDAPSREYCAVRRPRSNTPLQALVTLNDPQFVEAARGFAQRILLEGGGSTRERLVFGFRLATSRPPASDEIKILQDTLEKELADYKKSKESADHFLSVGAFKPKDGVNPSELAAWTTIASMLLNLDECLTKG